MPRRHDFSADLPLIAEARLSPFRERDMKPASRKRPARVAAPPADAHIFRFDLKNAVIRDSATGRLFRAIAIAGFLDCATHKRPPEKRGEEKSGPTARFLAT